MLATHLDVTGGQEEQGVVQLKADLRKAVLLTDSNRLGDFELIEFYVVATLLDPRSSKLKWICFKHKLICFTIYDTQMHKYT